MNAKNMKMQWTPCITEETHNGTSVICLETRHFSNRKLFLTGDVNEDMANRFVSEMMYLTESTEPVDIIINSCGGSIIDGLVIYDMIQACEGRIPINIYCTGMAASMGAILLCCGPKGRRYILPHSKVMLHEPLIASGVGGSASNIHRTAESILETKAMINEIIKKHTGRSRKEIDKVTAGDTFFTAEEAIKFGLCDEIRSPF